MKPAGDQLDLPLAEKASLCFLWGDSGQHTLQPAMFSWRKHRCRSSCFFFVFLKRKEKKGFIKHEMAQKYLYTTWQPQHKQRVFVFCITADNKDVLYCLSFKKPVLCNGNFTQRSQGRRLIQYFVHLSIVRKREPVYFCSLCTYTHYGICYSC